MQAHVLTFPNADPLPLLDEEFDKIDSETPPADHTFIEPVLLGDDQAWDDQLDNGQEMSI